MSPLVIAAFRTVGDVVTVQPNDPKWCEFENARETGYLREVEVHGSNSYEFSLTAKGRRIVEVSK